MKKLLLVLCICFVSALVEGQSIRYDTIRYARKYYQMRIALFTNEPIQIGRVIVLGNSITEFGDWKKLLNDSTAINRGIAADNTFGVLDRLEDVIIRQPGKLFIEIGINDLSQNIPIDTVTKNILKIVGRVREKSPETIIFVHSILPTNDNVKRKYPEAFHKNGQADLVNEQLKQKAKEIRYTYIDLNKELRDKDGKLDEKYAKPDGIHLNNIGYEIWVKLLKSKKYL